MGPMMLACRTRQPMCLQPPHSLPECALCPRLLSLHAWPHCSDSHCAGSWFSHHTCAQGRSVIKPVLAGIFTKIAERDTSEEGLDELYAFQLANPDMDLTPWTSKASDNFHAYIMHGLRKAAKRHQAQLQQASQSGEASILLGLSFRRLLLPCYKVYFVIEFWCSCVQPSTHRQAALRRPLMLRLCGAPVPAKLRTCHAYAAS